MKRLAFIAALLLSPLARAGSLPSLQWRALDTNGDPIANAILCSYEAGTSTQQDVYSDEALTTAITWPAAADSNGLLPKMYLEEDTAYKFVLKSAQVSSGCDGTTTYWTEDNVNPDSLTSSGINTRLTAMASDPLSVSPACAADGSTDDSTCMQAAFDAAQTARGVVDLLGKTYRIGSALTLASGVTLQNGTFDFSQDASGQLQIVGTAGSYVNLSATAAIGASAFTVASISGIASGDLIHIRSTETWNSSAELVGEIHEVESASGSTISIDDSLHDTYTTSPQYREITPVENVTLRNVRIFGDNGTTATRGLVSIRYARNILLDNVTIEDGAQELITVLMSRNVTIRDSVISTFGGSSNGLISVGDASAYVTVKGCKMASHFNYPFPLILLGTQDTDDGVTRFVTIQDNEFSIKTAVTEGVIDTDLAQYIYILNNRFIADTATDTAIDHEGADISIRGNEFLNFDSDVIILLPDHDTVTADVIEVVGNKFKNMGDSSGSDIVIKVATTAGSADLVSIRDNFIEGAHSTMTGIVATQTNTSYVWTNLVISGNVFNGTLGTLIDVDGNTNTILRTKVIGNTSEVFGGIVVTDSNYTLVANNDIEGDIQIDGDSSAITSATISGNIIDGTTGTNNIVIDGSDSAAFAGGISVTGNVCNGCDGPVLDIQGYAVGVAVTGNNFLQVDDTGSNVTIAGDAANAIDYVTITGNVLNNGAYAIATSNITDPIVTGSNVYIGQATGTVSGSAQAYPNLNITDIGSTCTAGLMVYDTGGATEELCFCTATDTWSCWSATTTAGPTD